MRIENVTDTVERTILIGMITSDIVVAKISPKWVAATPPFGSPYADVIGGFCVDYFDRYGKAPGGKIENMFRAWAEGKKDGVVGLVEKFLGELSGEYARYKKEVNPQFVLDLAEQHFSKVAARKLCELIQGDLDLGRVKKAVGRIENFSQFSLAAESPVDVLQDEALIDEVLSSKKDPLIVYPGGAGRFFDDVFERDGFVCFMGPPKRGKTNWLIDVAWRGMCQRRRVAFIEIGDMSRNQLLLRMYARAAARPVKPDVVNYPTGIEFDDEGEVRVTYDKREYKHRITAEEIRKGLERTRRRVKSEKSYLKMSAHPNGSIGAADIKGMMRDWVKAGWVPDVVIVDYADLLLPPKGYAEQRDGINATWKALRGISQELHCCVVTATQSNATSFKAGAIEMSHFSEDMRKLAHVTAMIGLNQTNHEKDQGVMRLNSVNRREGDSNTTRFCTVAGCVKFAAPCVVSVF